eukprot:scaffold907_cov247-Pinguiococcus_pyrenoidosus.AAC.20
MIRSDALPRIALHGLRLYLQSWACVTLERKRVSLLPAPLSKIGEPRRIPLILSYLGGQLPQLDEASAASSSASHRRQDVIFVGRSRSSGI